MRRGDPLLLGVCSGIAKRLGINTRIFRMIIFVSFIMTGFFPVGLVYLLLALFMEPYKEYRKNSYYDY